MLLISKFVGVLGLLLGSFEDLRTREVPDWLNFSMIFFGVGTAGFFSIYYMDKSFVLNSILGLAVCVALAYLMYYTHQWGGGDSKLLMAMGALIGLDLTSGIPLLLILLLNIAVFGAVYGLLYSCFLALKHRKAFKAEFKKRFYSDSVTRARKLNIFASVLLLIGIVLAPLSLKVVLFGIMLFLYATTYLFVFIKSVEGSCMIKDLPVGELTEGDWVVHEVKVDGDKVCGPDDVGLTKEQIEQLKNGSVDKVTVKEGIPFVPSFLFGFLATIAWGNWLLYLV